MLEAKNLQKELNRFLNEVIKESRKNLKKGNNIASKDLYNNLKKTVKINPNSIEADIKAEDYWKFINYGVKGVKSGKSLKGYKYTTKKPPMNKLLTWSKQKTGKFRRKDQKAQAFMIQNIVYNYGIKPTEFFTKPFEEAFKTLPDELVEAYALDVDSFLEFVIKDIE